MAGQALLLEALGHVAEAVGDGIHVGVVDLVGIAGEDDLGAVADAGDDGLDLVGRQVLGLIHDHELMGDAAPADVGEGLDIDQPLIQQRLVPFRRMELGAPTSRWR